MSYEIDDKEALRCRQILDGVGVPRFYLIHGFDYVLMVLHFSLVYQGMMRIFPFGGAVAGLILLSIAHTYCDISQLQKRTDDLKQARWRV